MKPTYTNLQYSKSLNIFLKFNFPSDFVRKFLRNFGEIHIGFSVKLKHTNGLMAHAWNPSVKEKKIQSPRQPLPT